MWFILRHGETLENNLKITQGQYESLLTLKGITQAKSMGYRILELNQDFSNYVFVSSPLTRTRHTTQIIMEITKQIENKLIFEPLIISKKKGIIERVKKTDFKTKYSEIYNNYQKDKWNYVFPNGESTKMVYERVKEFVKKYKDFENLIIVTHKSVAFFIKEILQNHTEEEIKNNFSNKDSLQNYFYLWNRKENIIKLV